MFCQSLFQCQVTCYQFYKGARRAPFWKKGPEGPLIFTAFHEKCNFCTYFFHWCSKWSPYTGWLAKSAISAPTLSVVLQMVHLYRLTGEKCNFCTYIVSGAPNGPSIQGDWGKVQFLHLHCNWCSKWSPYTGWLEKSAISAPTLSVVLQMVPYTCWLVKSAISAPTL